MGSIDGMRKLPKPVRKFCQPYMTRKSPTPHDNGAIHDLERSPRRAAHRLGQGQKLEVVVAPRRDRRANEDAVDEEG